MTGALCLQQFMASHAFQLQLAPVLLTTLTLLIKVSATVTDYRADTVKPSFPARFRAS